MAKGTMIEVARRREKVHKMFINKYSVAEIAEECKVSTQTINSDLRYLGFRRKKFSKSKGKSDDGEAVKPNFTRPTGEEINQRRAAVLYLNSHGNSQTEIAKALGTKREVIADDFKVLGIQNYQKKYSFEPGDFEGWHFVRKTTNFEKNHDRYLCLVYFQNDKGEEKRKHFYSKSKEEAEQFAQEFIEQAVGSESETVEQEVIRTDRVHYLLQMFSSTLRAEAAELKQQEIRKIALADLIDGLMRNEVGDEHQTSRGTSAEGI